MTPQQELAGFLIAVFSLLGFFLVSMQGWVDTLKQAGTVALIVAFSMLAANSFF